MDLRQLRYFKAVAEHGGFNAAAGILRIAQSALSRQIGLLEAECGGALFERGVHGVALTPPGEVLLRRARFLLRQAEEARDEVQAESANPRGFVRLGTTPSVGALLYQPVAERFLQRFPRVRLRLVEAITPDPLSSLLSGDLDLAIVPRPASPDGIAFSPLFLERFCVFGPLAGSAPMAREVGAEALLGIPLVVPSGVPWMSRLRPLVGERIREFEPRVEVVSMTCMTQMVRSGLGFGVVASWTIRAEVGRGEFWASQVDGLQSERGVALPTGRPIGRLARQLAGTVREVANDLVQAGALEAPLR